MPGAVLLDDVDDPSGSLTPTSRRSPRSRKPAAARVQPLISEARARQLRMWGDAALRWLVVGLAVVLGLCSIVTTEPLVSVRMGEAYASAGTVAIENTFSIRAAGERWESAHWLFDTALAALHRLGGWTLISLWVAAMAGKLAYTLQSLRWPHVSTWLPSLLTTLALFAVWPALAPTQLLMSPLLLAAVLAIDHHLRRNRRGDRWQATLLVMLPVVSVVACQLDDGGLLTVVVAALVALRQARPGTASSVAPSQTATTNEAPTPDEVTSRPSHNSPTRSPWRDRLAAYGAALGCLAAVVVHPFPGLPVRRFVEELTLLSPARATLPQDFPFAAYLAEPIWSLTFWLTPSLPQVAALLLAVAALAALALNRGLLSTDGVLTLLVLAVAMLDGRFWPAAAVACVVVTGRQLQGWLVARFDPRPSRDARLVRAAVVGRVATAAVLGGLAVAQLQGWLAIADGRRPGLGLAPWTQATIAGAATIAEADGPDRPLRPIHLSLRLGDALVWAGERSFVDHRLELFARDVRSYLQFRRNLATPAARLAVESRFERDDLNALLIDLSGDVPDYAGLIRTQRDPTFTLTELMPYAARFTPTWQTTVLDPEGRPAYSFPAVAFEDDGDGWAGGTDPQRPTTRPSAGRWLASGGEVRLPSRLSEQRPAVALARHHDVLLNSLDAMRASQRVPLQAALATRQVRLCQSILAERPGEVAAWQLLFNAYQRLRDAERVVDRQRVRSISPAAAGQAGDLRLAESIGTLAQLLRLQPQRRATYDALYALYLEIGQDAAALDVRERTLERFGNLAPAKVVDVERRDELEMLRSRVAIVRADLLSQRRAGEPPLRLSRIAIRQGDPAFALELLAPNGTAAFQMDRPRPEADTALLALVLLARWDEAADFLARQKDLTPVGQRAAVWLALARGDYDDALARLESLAPREDEAPLLQPEVPSEERSDRSPAEPPRRPPPREDDRRPPGERPSPLEQFRDVLREAFASEGVSNEPRQSDDERERPTRRSWRLSARARMLVLIEQGHLAAARPLAVALAAEGDPLGRFYKRQLVPDR